MIAELQFTLSKEDNIDWIHCNFRKSLFKYFVYQCGFFILTINNGRYSVLRFLPRYGKTMQLIVDGQSKTHQHYRQILEDHRKRPTETNSFLAAYDEEMKRRIANGEPLGSFTETQCFYLLADLYGAGVDTTLTTLRWFLLFMAAFPDEQVRVPYSLILHNYCCILKLTGIKLCESIHKFDLAKLPLNFEWILV